MGDWRQDLKKSSKQFLAYVWPLIEAKCGGGEIKPVEVLEDKDIARELDVLCGIDVWQTIGGEGARGIASRVQPTRINWETFTVRRTRFNGAKTEYQKRIDAINSNGRFIYPYLTCQAYIDDDKVLGIGLAKTADLYRAIEYQLSVDAVDHFEAGRTVWVKRTHNADFYCIHFWDVPGCWVYNSEKCHTMTK